MFESMTTDPQLATIEKGLRELTSKIEKLVPGADTPAQVRAIEVASKDLTEKIGKLLTPPTEQAQIAEYNSLSSFISNRRTQQMTVNALLVTGAGLALTFAVGGSASARVSGG